MVQDCDGDGQLTCRDFGLMHYLGYTPCREEPARAQQARDTSFYHSFSTCADNMATLLAREEYVPPPGYAPM